MIKACSSKYSSLSEISLGFNYILTASLTDSLFAQCGVFLAPYFDSHVSNKAVI